MDSSSNAEPALGDEIGGFRLERVLGEGSRAIVYEATQVGLDRRVAFKLIRDADPELTERVRRLEWPAHANVASLFATGVCEHGPWLAMRLATGGTLADRRRAQPLLEQVAAALDAAHAAGHVHGTLTAGNVLVTGDGAAVVSDFGLGSLAATADDDRAALAALVRRHGGAPRRRRPFVLAGLAALAATAVVVIAAGGGSGGEDATPVVPAGTQTLGSDLAPGGVTTVDCNGRPPDGASRACSVVQLTLAGRRTTVAAAGRITSWAVRGARGRLTLQVLRPRGGQLVPVRHSDPVRISTSGVQIIRDGLGSVEAGDRVAVEIEPGAGIGVRRAGRRASTQRWFGPLRGSPREPERRAGTGFDHELLLRVDVTPR